MTNRLGMDLGGPRAILVVLPTWVGDFVMATPMLRAIRERFVDAKITYLSEPNLRDLVHGCSWTDACVEWPVKDRRSILHRSYRDLVRLLRASKPDLAVLLPNSFRAALIAKFSGARRRVGYDRDGRGFLLTDRVPVTNTRNGDAKFARAQARGSEDVVVGDSVPVALGRYIPMRLVDYYADLAEALGCGRPNDRLELFTTAECERSVENRFIALGIANDHPLVVISPGAKYGAAKCWIPERFAAVADRLIDSHQASVLITCGPGEGHIAAEIAKCMKRKAFVFDRGAGEPYVGSARRAATTGRNITRAQARGSGLINDALQREGKELKNNRRAESLQRLSLGELKVLIQHSDLLLCNDAGPRHFAKAFGVPVVTVFGPTHPEWTATSYDKERIVRINVDCGPCQQRICPLGHLNCMTGVTVDAVYRAAVELLISESRVGMVGQSDG